MRNLLALAAAGVLLFAGVGWYLGWYRVSTAPAGDGGNKLTIDFNTKKINADLAKGKEKLKDALDGDKPQATSQPAPPPAPPSPTPPPPPPPTTSLPVVHQDDDGFFVLPPPPPPR